MKLFIGFEQVDLLTGITLWVAETHIIPSGSQRISICYIKDDANGVGEDQGYFGNIGLGSVDGCDESGVDVACSCRGTISGSSCSCLTGWLGAACSVVDCGTCVNGACAIVDGSAQCVCDAGFSGTDCTTEEASCTSTVVVEVATKKQSLDNGWTISKLSEAGSWFVVGKEMVGSFEDDSLYKTQLCLNSGIHKLNMKDLEGGGWHGGTIGVKLGSGDGVLVATAEVEANAKAEIFDIVEDTSRTCSDGIQNGPESDVDCGGDCVACSFRGKCFVDADCLVGGCAKDSEGEGLFICGEVGITPTKPEGYDVIIGGGPVLIEFEVGSDIDSSWDIDIDLESIDGEVVIEVVRLVGWSSSERKGSVSVELGKFLPSGMYRSRISWSGEANSFVLSDPFQLSGSSIEISEPSGHERLVTGMSLDVKLLTGGDAKRGAEAASVASCLILFFVMNGTFYSSLRSSPHPFRDSLRSS